jgi:hypothetical protein
MKIESSINIEQYMHTLLNSAFTHCTLHEHRAVHAGCMNIAFSVHDPLTERQCMMITAVLPLHDNMYLLYKEYVSDDGILHGSSQTIRKWYDFTLYIHTVQYSIYAMYVTITIL